MQTIELGRTGQQVSALALGAMQMGNQTAEPEAVRILDRYREIGGSFIDTADCYEWWARPGGHGGESEELLGRWLRAGGHRDETFLATKGSGMPRYAPDLWAADGTANWELARRTFSGAGADNLRTALDGSLRRLGTDHVDLYYVHVDDPATPLEETLEALAGFVQAGRSAISAGPTSGPGGSSGSAGSASGTAGRCRLVVAWLLHQTTPRVVPLIGPRTPEQFEDIVPALDVKLTDDHLTRLSAAGA